MKKFILGFAAGSVVIGISVVAYLFLGLADVRADAPPPPWLASLMSSSIHASIRRTTPPDLRNPQPADDNSLIAGGKLYLDDCVGCHGAPGKPPSDFGATFYPPAPQLARDRTQYSEAEIFWITKQGIRRTGMSAHGSSYSDQQLWLLAAFVKRINDLPASVQSALKEK